MSDHESQCCFLGDDCVACHVTLCSVSSQPASFSREMFVFTFMTCCLWGLVLQFMAGYFFLHSWLNLWGEVLRFADREFYSVRKVFVFLASLPILCSFFLSCILPRTGGHAPHSQLSTASGIFWSMTGSRPTFTKT